MPLNYKEDHEVEKPMLTDEQFKLLERCLKMYFNACELIDETNNDFVDTSSERNDVVHLSNVLEEIFGKTIDLW